MTQRSLAYLLKNNSVPPEFVGILVNNNGAYTCSVQYGDDGTTSAHIRMASTPRWEGEKLITTPGLLWGVTRSLFNYLVPMLQDKQAKEEGGEGGKRPGQIGQVKG